MFTFLHIAKWIHLPLCMQARVLGRRLRILGRNCLICVRVGLCMLASGWNAYAWWVDCVTCFVCHTWGSHGSFAQQKFMRREIRRVSFPFRFSFAHKILELSVGRIGSSLLFLLPSSELRRLNR